MCKSPTIPIVYSSEVAFRADRMDEKRAVIGVKASTVAGLLLSRRNKEDRTIVKIRSALLWYDLGSWTRKKKKGDVTCVCGHQTSGRLLYSIFTYSI